MGLFDVPTSAGGSLFGPDLERAAALQGLFAMGNAVGAASQPSPTPGVNPFAAAGQAGPKASSDFIKNSVGLGLLNLQMLGAQEDLKAKQRKEALLASIFPQLGAGAPASSIAAPGATSAAPGAPGAPQNSIFNDTPQNRLLFSLGLGQDPSKIYSAPTTKMMPLPGSGMLAEHEYRGGQWTPITGQPQAEPGRAYTPEGSLAPIAGGSQDPRTLEIESYAKEKGQAPFKGYPFTQGGGVAFPWAGGGPNMGGGTSGSRAVPAGPSMAGGPGSPAAPGPSMRPLPGGRGLMFSDPDALGKEANTDVEKGMVSDSEILSQLSRINQRFRPEYQTFKFRGLQEWSSFKDKIDPKLVDPGDRQKLADFSQYKSEAAQFFSITLKALSGAAVTPAEMKRAETWIPNPGTGIFDGDSPTVVKANIERLTDFTRNAIAKKAYIRERGMKVDGVDIDQMPKIMNDYGNAMVEQFKGEGMSETDARNAAVRAVALRFGLLSPK